MYYDSNILEEELKNKVGTDWFDGFDTTSIHGRIASLSCQAFTTHTIANVE